MSKNKIKESRSQKEICILSLTICLLMIVYPIAVLELAKYVGIGQRIDTVKDLFKYIGCSTIYIFLSYSIFYYISKAAVEAVTRVYYTYKSFLKKTQ